MSDQRSAGVQNGLTRESPGRVARLLAGRDDQGARLGEAPVESAARAAVIRRALAAARQLGGKESALGTVRRHADVHSRKRAVVRVPNGWWRDAAARLP